MTRTTDLAERIARLERLLDRLEQSRPGAAPASSGGDAATVDSRLRDLIAMLQQRLGETVPDEADAIAMRALLEEYRAMTAELRAQASALDQRLEEVAARLRDGHGTLEALEDCSRC
jgi:ubiquinone biosynthesis protein UbiJ